MKYSILDCNYFVGLLLASTLGFDKVDCVDGNYFFTAKKSSPLYIVEKRQTIRPNLELRAYQSGCNLPINHPYNIANPIPLYENKGYSVTNETTHFAQEEFKQLVPFALTIPTRENATIKNLYCAFKAFFEKIVKMYESKNEALQNYNINNISRIYSTAKCFIHSSPKKFANDVLLEPFASAYYTGINYNGKQYLGAMRKINALNFANSSDVLNLINYVKACATQLCTSSILTDCSIFQLPYFQNLLQNNLALLYCADAEGQAILKNQNIPNVVSLKQSVINGLNGIAHFLLPPKRKK